MTVEWFEDLFTGLGLWVTGLVGGGLRVSMEFFCLCLIMKICKYHMVYSTPEEGGDKEREEKLPVESKSKPRKNYHGSATCKQDIEKNPCLSISSGYQILSISYLPLVQLDHPRPQIYHPHQRRHIPHQYYVRRHHTLYGDRHRTFYFTNTSTTQG